MPDRRSPKEAWASFLRVRRWNAAYWQTPQLEVFATPGPPKKLFYLTRSAFLEPWLKHDNTLPSIVAFTRAGLVTEAYGDLIRAMSVTLGLAIDFVGSLTPGDLLTFLTLRSGGLRLTSHWGSRGLDVRYSGIDDRWLDLRDEYASRRAVTLGLSQVLVPMSPDDEAELEILERLLPSIESLLGPRTAAILHSRKMLFVEGLTNPQIYGGEFITILRRHLTTS